MTNVNDETRVALSDATDQFCNDRPLRIWLLAIVKFDSRRGLRPSGIGNASDCTLVNLEIMRNRIDTLPPLYIAAMLRPFFFSILAR